VAAIESTNTNYAKCNIISTVHVIKHKKNNICDKKL